jgi:arylsulfatase A-like enzyme
MRALRSYPGFLPLRLLLSLAAILAMIACGHRRRGGDGFDLRELVAAHHYVLGGWRAAGLSFPLPPRVGELAIDDETRPVVLGSPGGWIWRGRVPAGARLHVGAQAVPPANLPARGLAVLAEVRGGGRRHVFRAVTASPPQSNAPWLDLDADLAPWAGRQVEIAVSAVPAAPLPATLRREPAIAWGPAGIFVPRPSVRPNVIFILVDTLRRDRLTPYGYGRDTSPQVARWLAAPGTVVEQAYSQASWTLPSVTSFMTGRYTEELVGARATVFRVPAAVVPLAERMADLGFATGGFLANPVLDVASGLTRGFQTLYRVGRSSAWRPQAVDINRHAIPWLAAHRDRPFFLYLHYADPHDPYDNADIIANRSPFEAAYSGPVTGSWPQGLNVAGWQLPDPPRDLAHLNALYDAEVRFVDRAIGEVLRSLPPAVLAHTLVVLTADHGEELHDHGGWKHGQTLFDEMIHVPLILRWDGHIQAGRRMKGTVRLLDLLPTLLDAAGGAPEPAAEGMDLLPFLESGRQVPELPAFAGGFSVGPLRAAAVLGQTKLMLFNREEPYKPRDEREERLYRRDLGRLARIERFDLARDPGERDDLSGLGGVTRLEEVVARRLDRGLQGLHLLVQEAPVGSRVEVTLRFARPAAGCYPYFLGADDRIESCGDEVRLVLRGEALDKGVLVEGRPGALLSAAASAAGQPLPAARIRLGSGFAYRGGAVRPEGLLAPGYPAQAPRGSGCRVLIWSHADGAAPKPASDEEAAETRRRLLALGYVR